MAAHNELGKWGEDLAADYLQRKGYTIIERDWKSGRRDLDIVAKNGNVILRATRGGSRLPQTAESATGHQPLHQIQAYQSGSPFRHHLHRGNHRHGA